MTKFLDGPAEDMAERPKFPRSVAMDVWMELRRCFDPQPAWLWSGDERDKPQCCPQALCDRLCIVGGFRRGKLEMKDIELLYIPRRRLQADAGDLFGAEAEQDLTEQLIARLVADGIIEPRLNVAGHRSAWGPWNKHARHVATGLAIDLFAATPESYANRLVVTTGPMASNIAIAAAARKKGWEWEVNSPGFVPLGGTWETCPRERRTMRSEREVFAFVDLPFLPPEQRS